MRKRTILLLVLLVLVALGLGACNSEDGDDSNPASSNAPQSYITLDVNAALERFNAEEDAVIVDVREPNEWAATGVPQGATLIPLRTITGVQSGAVDGLPKDKPIYVICNSGNRSRVAAEHLINLGYGPVYNIDGGIQAWLSQNLPVESYAG